MYLDILASVETPRASVINHSALRLRRICLTSRCAPFFTPLLDWFVAEVSLQMEKRVHRWNELEKLTIRLSFAFFSVAWWKNTCIRVKKLSGLIFFFLCTIFVTLCSRFNDFFPQSTGPTTETIYPLWFDILLFTLRFCDCWLHGFMPISRGQRFSDPIGKRCTAEIDMSSGSHQSQNRMCIETEWVYRLGVWHGSCSLGQKDNLQCYYCVC